MNWDLNLLYGVAAAALVGFSKTGVPGLGILIVPLMAMLFVGKDSVGALLPMLILGDLFALAYYRRHARWEQLWRLLPWVVVGMIPGGLVLWKLDNKSFIPFLGGMVLVLVALELARRKFRFDRVPQAWWFVAGAGFLCGFATTVGNVAGPIMGIYLLSMGLGKKEFMGTGAWYYFIVNSLKIPIFLAIGIINRPTLTFDLWAIPVIAVGALIGAKALPRIPQKVFDGAVIFLAAIAALRLVLAG